MILILYFCQAVEIPCLGWVTGYSQTWRFFFLRHFCSFFSPSYLLGHDNMPSRATEDRLSSLGSHAVLPGFSRESLTLWELASTADAC